MKNLISKLTVLKVAVFVCVFIALFMSYQLPGSIQTPFKMFFLGLSAFMMFLITSHSSQAGYRKINMVLFILILLTLFLYLLEK
jgi:hypothetical protein